MAVRVHVGAQQQSPRETVPTVGAPPPSSVPTATGSQPAPSGSRGGIDSSGDIPTLQATFARAARSSWTDLPAVDVAAAVDAAMLTEARNTQAKNNTEGRNPGPGLDRPAPSSSRQVGNTSGAADQAAGVPDVSWASSRRIRGRLWPGRGVAMAAEVGAAAATTQRQGLPPTATAPVDWSGFGQVIPVIGASAGVGASVLAAVITDVVQLAARCALLVDTADPARSGLATAAGLDGPRVVGPHPQVGVRLSWRAQALVARLHTSVPIIAPGMLPPPRFWRPPVRTVHVTVVDMALDPWRIAANPIVGAGAWLRAGTPAPRPILVVRPSRPSLLLAEQLLARLEPWVTAGVATPPHQLAVMGASRWPPGVAGAAGRRVAALAERAIFIPHDTEIALGGVTSAPTPPRLRAALTPVLRAWGVLPPARRPVGRPPQSRRRP